MNRRKFLETNALGAAGSMMLGGVSSAAAAEGTVSEKTRDIDLVDSADIVVLGGGPAGCAAALAAARLGMDVLLIERYGYLGGMATGGLVIMYAEYDRGMKGIVSEFADRILKDGGRMVETNRIIRHERFFNPDVYAYMCLDMLRKDNVRLRLHSWAVGAQVRGDRISTLFIESKSGRQAINPKMVIDCTGDADTAAWVGIPHENTTEPNGLGLDFIYGNMDFDRFRQFQTYESEKWNEIANRSASEQIGWRPWYIGWNDKAWFNTNYKGSPTDVGDLTACEIDIRSRIMRHLEFYRKNVPGFEQAALDRTAHQIGCRISRRIIGGHVITKQDLERGTFDDTIGKICPIKEGELLDVPYRALVPQKIENVLYAGRCISGTVDVINVIRGISGCIVFGQGAGAAAALSLKEGVIPRKLDIPTIQETLRKQGVAI